MQTSKPNIIVLWKLVLREHDKLSAVSDPGVSCLLPVSMTLWQVGWLAYK